MKKIIWSMLLTMVFCIGLCPLKARAEGTTFNVDTDGRYNGSSGGTFDVTVSGGEVTIKRNSVFYMDLPKDLTVPTTVYDENGTQYTVTNLGEYCLDSCIKLESVKLPDNITWIPNNCFSTCKSLKTISIPEGVGSIGTNAFQGCSALENVELPNSLTTISVSAFSGCTKLESIKLPDNVSTIAGWAFNGSNLKSVTLSVPSKLQATDDPFFNTPLITEDAGSVLLYSAQGVSDKATDFEGTYNIFTDSNNYKVPGGNIYCASYKADSGLDVTTTTDASGSVPVLVCEVTGADRVYAKVDGKTTAIDAENGKCTYRIKAVKYDSSDEIVPVIFSLEDDGNGSSGSNDDKKGSGDDDKKGSDDDDNNSSSGSGDNSSSQSDYNYLEKLDSVLNNAIKKGGAQTIEWNEGTTLSYEIMKTLEQNPNITLIFSYKWNNVNYRVVIPGRMVKADKNIPYYGPAYLYKLYGANAVAIKANDANVSHSYTVEKGDTLSALAGRLHIGIDRLVALNKISNPNLIKEGQVLIY